MDEVWKALSSPAWWLSVVVAGILINLVARRLDGWLGKVSKRWAERTGERKAKRVAYIERLKEAKHEQVMKGIEGLAVSVAANRFMAAGCVLIFLRIASGFGGESSRSMSVFLDSMWAWGGFMIFLGLLKFLQSEGIWATLNEVAKKNGTE